MSFYAKEFCGDGTYDYLNEGFSSETLMAKRWFHLMNLNYLADITPFKLSLRDPVTNAWTKWQSIHDYKEDIRLAYDVHRSVLYNEIIIESDYETYDDNYDAAKLVGSVLEKKGFKPLYYYSGNKSIHIHVFFDFKCLNEIDIELQEYILATFSKNVFVKKFMEFLRNEMISMFGLNLREFDEQLKADSHLIRAELSKNKRGYKTFLGYSWENLSFIPELCNEHNGYYPVVGEVVFSSPNNPQELIEEFLQGVALKKKKGKIRRRETSLNKWLGVGPQEDLRPLVKFLLSEEFISCEDGRGRAMFILANEAKEVLGEDQARIIVQDWNARMGHPIKDSEIEYRLKSAKNYFLKDDYIVDFLSSLGFGEKAEKLRGKS